MKRVMNSPIGNLAKKEVKMKKVYVITKGEYSNYHICAIFSDKKKAKEITGFFIDGYERVGIEEWLIDVVPPENRRRFSVFMRKNGDVKEINKDKLYDVADFKNAVTEWWDKEGWTFQVWAKDRNHAIKIAKDWRRKLLLGGKNFEKE